MKKKKHQKNLLAMLLIILATVLIAVVISAPLAKKQPRKTIAVTPPINISTPVTTLSTKGWKTWTSTTKSYSVRYPATWGFDEIAGGSRATDFFGPTVNPNTPYPKKFTNVSIIVTQTALSGEGDPIPTKPDYGETQIQSMLADIRKNATSKEKTITIGGQQAIKIAYTDPEDQRAKLIVMPLNAIQVMKKDAGIPAFLFPTIFTFTLNDAQYLPEFNTMLNTIRFFQ